MKSDLLWTQIVFVSFIRIFQLSGHPLVPICSDNWNATVQELTIVSILDTMSSFFAHLQWWTLALSAQKLVFPLLLMWVPWLWPGVSQQQGMPSCCIALTYTYMWVRVPTHSCSQCLQTDNACGWCIYNKECSAISGRCTNETNWFQVCHII